MVFHPIYHLIPATCHTTLYVQNWLMNLKPQSLNRMFPRNIPSCQFSGPVAKCVCDKA